MSAVYGNASVRPAAMGKLWADALSTQLKKDSIWRTYLYRDDGPWELTPYRMKWRGKWRRKTYDLVGTFDGWEYGDDIHVARLGLEKAFG